MCVRACVCVCGCVYQTHSMELVALVSWDRLSNGGVCNTSTHTNSNSHVLYVYCCTCKGTLIAACVDG